MPSPVVANSVLGNHEPGAPVARRSAHGDTSAAELLRDAARVAAELPPAFPGSHVALAIARDRYAFAAAFLGAIARGHEVALPPEVSQPWLGRLGQRSDTAAVVHDSRSNAGLRIDRFLAEDVPFSPLCAAELRLCDRRVTLHLGDGWRDARSVSLSGPQLIAEACALATLLALPPGAHVVSSLPLGGRYELVCGLLVALLHGGSFEREVLSRPDALPGAAAELLVTTPAHLRAIARAGRGQLAAYARVLSSRGALDGSLAGHPHMTDLLASTALGSVAYRREVTQAFVPVPGVEVECGLDARLRVRSPYRARELASTFDCDELGLSASGGFRPLGKLGRVLQTGEVFVSLEQLGERLSALPGVHDAVVVSPEPQRGALLIAAVADADLPVEAQLCEHALASCPPGAPRPEVRRVQGPIRDAAGRPLRGEVFRHFGLGPDGEALQLGLSFEQTEASAEGDLERRCFRVQIPENYAYFEGHFPGYPILPGAAQLSALVVPCVRRARPELGRLQHMSRVKFTARIKPADAVDVVLSWQAAAPTVEFTLRRDATLCAGGKLGFLVAEVAP